MKRLLTSLILGVSLLLGLALSTEAQGPFSAQIQVALRSVGITPGGGQTRTTVTVDSATTFAVSSQRRYVVLECTGAETINTITGAVAGQILYLENSDTDCTIADDDAATAANALDLTGTGANDTGAVAKVMEFIYNGTYWLQISESDN